MEQSIFSPSLPRSTSSSLPPSLVPTYLPPSLPTYLPTYLRHSLSFSLSPSLPPFIPHSLPPSHLSILISPTSIHIFIHDNIENSTLYVILNFILPFCITYEVKATFVQVMVISKNYMVSSQKKFLLFCQIPTFVLPSVFIPTF